MDADSRLSVLAILILLALAAIFAVSETAFASASQAKLKVSADRGDDRAERASYIMDNIESAITTLLICTNIVHLTIATVVTVLVTRWWGLSLVSVSTIITTLVVFFVGEMLPKSIAKKNPEKYALKTAGFLQTMMKVFGPLANLLTWIGMKTASFITKEVEISVTEDELKDMFEDLAGEGVLDEDQEDMMSSLIDFTDTRTGRILTPRKDVVGIDINLSDQEVFDLVSDLTHSRVVVYDGDIENVKGILRIREYLKQYLRTGVIPSVKELMVDPYWVSSTTMLDELLEEMSQARQNIALVRGVNGKFLGLVSIEDILEELVGDIYDESDEEGGQES